VFVFLLLLLCDDDDATTTTDVAIELNTLTNALTAETTTSGDGGDTNPIINNARRSFSFLIGFLCRVIFFVDSCFSFSL
jgi:hypothetical protein